MHMYDLCVSVCTYGEQGTIVVEMSSLKITLEEEMMDGV